MQELLPIVGVVIGWLLSSLSNVGVDRRQRRRAIGRGLAEGIELRRRLCVPAESLREELLARLGPGYELDDIAAKQFDGVLKEWISGFPISLDGLRAALNELAEEDPILAERIRSIVHLEQLTRHFEQLRIAVATDISDEEWHKVMKITDDYFVGVLDQALDVLASKHGLLTRFRFRRLLRNWEKIPQELEPVWHQSIARIRALSPGETRTHDDEPELNESAE
jgi:hypothetical protein